ncbi:Smr/MutS family protein [Mucilaginibacter sp. UR6-11]|uniref:Smr/MutS family protein n=1 Tax=Mucilaginibacter sp. UR6-11 TaxID=1435644 RepID=UPI001E2AEAB9|nr:Smr/MutS family protein [Mucilaginibacter sp. UR6-11]MCC8423742.1 Smr/MutS family protein [Mucilaginibacter sp. UR6-11]
MQYKLGDFVRFVDEKMEGFITRIIDEDMIGVTGEDDFEIPVLARKVTLVHGYKAAGSETTAATSEPQTPAAEFKTKGVYLGVVADAKANSVVHFNLINDTTFRLLATLITDKNGFKGEYAGIIAPQSAVKIYSAQLADLQLWPRLTINVLYYTTQNIEVPAPLTVSEKFKAKDFAGSKKSLPVLNQQGWLIQLDEPDFVIDARQLKEAFYKPAEEKVAVQKPQREIDLHIEKLRDDYQFLSSAEIQKIQLDHFNKALDSAIVHQLHDVVFIHGAGNGILRHEIHKALSKHPKVQTFMDALKEKFGYGATRVVLK